MPHSQTAGVPHSQAQGYWLLVMAELVPGVPEEFYLIWITAATTLDDTFVTNTALPSLADCEDWLLSTLGTC